MNAGSTTLDRAWAWAAPAFEPTRSDLEWVQDWVLSLLADHPRWAAALRSAKARTALLWRTHGSKGPTGHRPCGEATVTDQDATYTGLRASYFQKDSPVVRVRIALEMSPSPMTLKEIVNTFHQNGWICPDWAIPTWAIRKAVRAAESSRLVRRLDTCHARFELGPARPPLALKVCPRSRRSPRPDR